MRNVANASHSCARAKRQPPLFRAQDRGLPNPRLLGQLADRPAVWPTGWPTDSATGRLASWPSQRAGRSASWLAVGGCPLLDVHPASARPELTINQQPKTYPHPQVPAARLICVFPVFFGVLLSPGETLKSGVGITFWVPNQGLCNLTAQMIGLFSLRASARSFFGVESTDSLPTVAVRRRVLRRGSPRRARASGQCSPRSAGHPGG